LFCFVICLWFFYLLCAFEKYYNWLFFIFIYCCIGDTGLKTYVFIFFCFFFVFFISYLIWFVKAISSVLFAFFNVWGLLGWVTNFLWLDFTKDIIFFYGFFFFFYLIFLLSTIFCFNILFSSEISYELYFWFGNFL